MPSPTCSTDNIVCYWCKNFANMQAAFGVTVSWEVNISHVYRKWWWRHGKVFRTTDICEGNSPVIGGFAGKAGLLVFTLLLIKQTDEQTRTLMARKCHDDAILESVFFNWMADCKWTVHCIPYGINFVSGISIKFLHITNWTIRYISWYDAVGTESWQVFLRVIFTGAIIFGIERSLSNVCRVFICFACEIITYRWLSKSLQ